MNAIKFLLDEHDKIRHHLAEISKDIHKFETKKAMFDALCDDLVVHETMEQKVWYPLFKKYEKLDDTVKHLIAEEKDAAKVIKTFKQIKTQEKWDEKFLAFKKDVEHHASEEETKLFPKVKRILNDLELEKVGKEMREFKNEFSES